MPTESQLRQTIWLSIPLLVVALLFVPALHDGLRDQPFELALLVVALTFWGAAVYAITKRRDETLVERFFWLNIATAIVLAYGNPAPDEVSWDRPIEVAGMALLPALFYGFFHLLTGRGDGPKSRLFARGLAAGGIASGALLLSTESSAMLLNNASHVLLYACLLAGFVGGIIDLFRGYLQPRSEHHRRQLQVVLIGACLAVVPLITLYLLPGVLGNQPVVPPQLPALSLAFLPLSLSYAVLRHHLFDIDAAVDRGLVYAMMTLLLAGCYALFLAGLELLGFRPNSFDLLPSVVFFAAVAAGFVPLWTWVRERIDCLIYRDRYDYARTLRELGTQLASIQPLDEVLAMVVHRVAEAMNLTGAAILLEQGEEGLAMRAASGEYADESRGRVLVEQVLQAEGEALHGRRFPLVAGGEVHGLLYLGPKRIPGELSGQDVTLVETLAMQAAVAVENAALVDRLRVKVEELGLLRDRLLQVQEEERKRVAQMIHDDILAVQLQMLSRMEGAMSSFNEQSEAVLYLRQGIELGEYGAHRLREACAELYPTELKHYGLVPALAKLTDQVGQSEFFEVVFSCTDFPDDRRLPKEIEDALYRSVKQALDNIRRHAGAKLVRVALSLTKGHVVLIVSDDGGGFDVLPSSATLLRHGHLGLVTIRESIEGLGGTCQIESALGKGTRIQVVMPVPDRVAKGTQQTAGIQR